MNKTTKKKKKQKIEKILKRHPEWLPPQVPITDAYMESMYGKPAFSVRKGDGTFEHWYKRR